MKKNVLIFGGVAILFAVFGIFFAIQRLSPAPAESSAVSTFLSQTMKDANGQEQALGQWKDQVLIVNFWATWCAPCVDEMPELSNLQRELSAQKIQILGIGIDSAANIVDFAKKYSINYPLYVGGINGSELSRQLGNQGGGLPFTVIIGRDGQVRKTYLGRLKMDELRKTLTSL
ncbi:TlpA disulfide reductase family protein [Noviherbaspirillum denitrificans]|uniref:Alkyl hydroperoxide reductase n=1 Tax=Noviherbaspirillum denitrificans TaxID=1968433 RepID=A0A254T8S6_9BURK|nr:TlpA disulfide reductase family protein [Noviherbaspirillum denitrificans]OWW19039.1 alkyl hydroperoxide reductase [Noviherbaspirillum denitrificans]